MSKHSLQTAPKFGPVDGSLYGAGLVVVLSGLLGAWPLLTLPGFRFWMLLLIGAGIPCSVWLRARGARRVTVNRAVGLAALLSGLGLISLLVPLRWLLRPGFLPHQLVYWDGMKFLVHAITWVIAFRCFTLLTDLDVLLSIVPSLSLLILVAILENSTYVLIWLVSFLAGSLYLTMRHQQLRLRNRADEIIETREGDTEWRRDVRTLGQMAGLIGIFSVVIALLMSELNLPQELITNYGLKLAARISRVLMGLTQTPYAAVSNELDVGKGWGWTGKTLLLRVRTEKPALWRGNVYDTYNGRCWTVSDAVSHSLAHRERGTMTYWLSPLPEEPPEGGKLFRQEFTVVAPQMGLLYAAYEPLTVTVGGGRLYENRYKRLDYNGFLYRGTKYTVISRPKEASPARLRQAPAKIPPALHAQMQRYLQVPDCVPSRVRALTMVLCAGRTNNYDKVKRLERYLADTHTYTRSPEPIPPGQEVVDYFLFEMKDGSCQHFATALAIMARLAGIPTRLVDGYTSGELDVREGVFEVRERDAHAWVEVYFPQEGWFSFDPTAMATETITGLGKLSEWLRTRWQAWNISLGRWLARVNGRLLAVVGELRRRWLPLLGILLGVGGLIFYRTRTLRPQTRWQPHLRPRRQVARQYERMCRLLARYGLPRQPYQTALEYKQLVAQRFPAVVPFVARIVHTYLEGQYSPRIPSPSQLAACGEALRNLAAQLRQPRS
ncbi:MAG TPA: DUF4129 domain-containing protein [Armatimonadetes bacterium]|nr:DUF4129 domain-containing protein [Armatimonadota bacterium]